jgi:hypothetical protein
MSSDQSIKLDESLWKQILIDHILGDISFAIQSNRELIAAQLILAAIDIFAGLSRPRSQEYTNGDQFITWCEKYMLLEGRCYRLTGQDLWGARCGFLHGYTPISNIFRQGRAKMLSYVDDANEDIITSEEVDDLVIVSLTALYKYLCTGLLGELAQIRANSELTLLVNQRLSMMFYNKKLDDKFKLL